MPKKDKTAFERFRDLAQRVVNAPKPQPPPKQQHGQRAEA